MLWPAPRASSTPQLSGRARWPDPSGVGQVSAVGVSPREPAGVLGWRRRYSLKLHGALNKIGRRPEQRGDVRTAQAIGLPGVHNAPCRSVSASTHESRVLTQARGAEPYRGMLRVGAQCGLRWSIDREEGPSVPVHPWPDDALWLMSTLHFRSPQGRRRSVHLLCRPLIHNYCSEREKY